MGRTARTLSGPRLWTTSAIIGITAATAASRADRPAGEIANLHYTNGGPYFPEYARCGYADLWFAERDRMLSCAHTPAALAKAV